MATKTEPAKAGEKGPTSRAKGRSKGAKGSCKHERTVCLQAVQLFGVKAKWLLVLECILVCSGLTVLTNFAFDGMRYNDHFAQIMWCVLHILMSLVNLSLWAIAYPKRHHRAKIALAAVVASVLIIPGASLRACRGTLFTPSQPDQAEIALIVGELTHIPAVALTFFAWMALYHGPIKNKGVFVCALLSPPLMIAQKVVEVAQLGNMFRYMIIGFAFLLFFGIGLFGGDPIWKDPKVIKGPRRSFIGVVGFVFCLMAVGLMYLFLGVYYRLDSPLLRTGAWLFYKMASLAIINFWSKMACYAMLNDVQSLLLVFMMVLLLQFSTELTFVAIKPFQFEFFVMLLLKAAFHILQKGGLLWKLYARMRDCIHPEKNGFCKLIFKVGKAMADRGAPYLHLHVEDGDGRILQKYLTDLIYCEAILISGVICSLGCTAAVGVELAMLRYFPDTFHQGVWTSRIDPDTDPWMVFAGYIFVSFSNMASAFVVLWLFLRDSMSVAALGVLRNTVDEHRNLVYKFAEKSLERMSSGRRSSHSLSQIVPEAKAFHEIEDSQSVHLLRKLFYKAKMHLHVFEQLFFHEETFYLYFWSFFVIVAVVLNVTWNQWSGYLEQCGFDEMNHFNFSRLSGVPTRVKEVIAGNDCWFYSDNTSFTTWNNSQPSAGSAFQCIYYYSNETIYI